MARMKRSRAPVEEPERLQKVLSRLGLASRREAEEWIRAGRLMVNGQPAVLGMRVTAADKMQLDGRPIRQPSPKVTAAEKHKPALFLCHRSTGEELKDLIDRIPRRAGKRFIAISPMPRIDGGLELVTADGKLAARLQRVVHRLNSEFSVRVRGEMPETALQGVLEGTLDRGERLAVESCDLGGGEGANRWYTLIARGGSGKDVRQLFERQGAQVSRVLRTRVGTLALERHFARGQFRELSAEELEALLSTPTNESTEPRSSVP